MAGTQYTEMTERTMNEKMNDSITSRQYNGQFNQTEYLTSANHKLFDKKKINNKFPARLDKIFVSQNGKMT